MTVCRDEIISEVTALVNKSSGCCFLRKGELIFKSSIKDDIDILVSEKANIILWEYLKNLGFKKKIDSKFFNVYLYGSKPHIHYINTKLNLHFDCVFGLYHKSVHVISEPGFEITHWIPLDNVIQEESIKNFSLLDVNGCTVNCLNLEVELVHIIAHVILDKKGQIDTFYKTRILYLLSRSDMEQVKMMLQLVFFNFTEHLIECIKCKSFDSLFADYLTYGDY